MSPTFYLTLYFGTLFTAVAVFLLWFFYKKIFESGRISRSMNLELLLVRFPPYHPEHELSIQQVREKIALMEQLYSHLIVIQDGLFKTLLYGKPFFALELTIPHIGEEISYYIAVPRRMVPAVEKIIQGVFPEADVEKSKDYNIFNPEGTVAGAILSPKANNFYPLKTYQKLEGFRAIMVPFLATFGIYFLLKGLRLSIYSSNDPPAGGESRSYHNEKFFLRQAQDKLSSNNIIYLLFAGIFIGLGFHTYIAFRFIPFVLAVPILWYLWQWWDEAKSDESLQATSYKLQAKSCAPCAVVLFLFMTFVVALPIGWYFLQNPADFLGRGGQVSIFTAQSPAFEFLKSNLATLGMFFVYGDCNWRHNFACQPELHPIVAFFFSVGLISILWKLIGLRNTKNLRIYENESERNQLSYIRINSYFVALLLLSWLFFLSLPATLTREGLPHALRTIGMIPPVMILSGLGAYTFIQKIIELLEKAKIKWPEVSAKVSRIQREAVFLFIFVILLSPVFTYRDYFLRWAHHPNTYFSFATDTWHAGQFLNRLPNETYKYVVVNQSGVDVRGIPMPAQNIMFATDTFREEKRTERNITYLLPEEINEKINPPDKARVVIMPLNGKDSETKQKIREKFPDYEFKAPSDFVIFSNYYKF